MKHTARVADTTCYYTSAAAAAVQHNAHNLRTPKLLLLFNTTRTLPGPLSTGGASITMDGGVADTAHMLTLNPY